MRLLILEDDPIIAMHISNIAQFLGHQTKSTDNSEDALQIAESSLPDLVVADVDLGAGGDGIDAAVLIHDLTGIKALFLTGLLDSATRDRAQHAWPVGFMSKPLDDLAFERMLNGIAGMNGRHSSLWSPSSVHGDLRSRANWK